MSSGCKDYYMNEQKTQGRKGEKMPRINMAFTPVNLEFLHIMAAVEGTSITRYVNRVIEQERKQNNPFHYINLLILNLFMCKNNNFIYCSLLLVFNCMHSVHVYAPIDMLRSKSPLKYVCRHFLKLP